MCNVHFFLNIHMVHPYFESHNIPVGFYYLNCDVWCMFYDILDWFKVYIKCNIVVRLSSFVWRMP
jgi:hypothetical protein